MINILKTLNYKNISFLILILVVISLLIKQDSLKNEIIALQKELISTQSQLIKCNSAIQNQNKQIEELRVEVKAKENKQIEKVRNIYIKDQSCTAELKAYKELFNLSGVQYD